MASDLNSLALLVTAAITAGNTALLYRQSRRHESLLKSIPIRIHINGTRGKSTVTRLIAAGLRAGGIRTIAKTTGTSPRIILEDGSECMIIRRNGASIGEQIHAIEFAAGRNAQAVVLECMAVNPEYQWICEHKIIKSGIGVITNVRMDHTDLMGSSLRQIASCLANTIPQNGTLVTAETRCLETLKSRAEQLGTTVCRVEPSGVSDQEISEFSYPSFKDNISVALSVCGLLGIDRTTALSGMHAALPDPGVLQVCKAVFGQKEVVFINALAANDVASTRQLWDAAVLGAGSAQKALLFCSRKERSARNAEFVSAMTSGWNFDMLILAGEGTTAIRRRLLARKIQPSRIVDLGMLNIDAIPDRILSCLSEESMVFAAGNIIGIGEAVADYFYKRGTDEPVCADIIHRAYNISRPV